MMVMLQITYLKGGFSMPQGKNDSNESATEQTTNFAGDATQSTTNFVQNTLENATEATGNLVNRTVNATQNLVNRVVGNNNKNNK